MTDADEGTDRHRAEDPIEVNRARWEDRAEIHPDTGYYDVSGFVEDGTRSTLRSPERELLGDVSGASLVHLQCHIGLDTLSWARAGADAVGVDFSRTAIETARGIRDDAGLADRADFVHCELEAAPDRLGRAFDVVFASYGVLPWIPDVDRWVRTAATLCSPGGTVFLADHHPVIRAFDRNLDLREDRSYFRSDPVRYEDEGTYADPDAAAEHTAAYEWQHGLGEVVTAFARAGLRVETLREYPTTDFEAVGGLEETDDGSYRLPGDPLPLVFALRATRP